MIGNNVLTIVWIAVFLALGLLSGSALLHCGTRWGSTTGERARKMPGDEYLENGPRVRVVMTRAVAISTNSMRSSTPMGIVLESPGRRTDPSGARQPFEMACWKKENKCPASVKMHRYTLQLATREKLPNLYGSAVRLPIQI